MKLSRRLKHIYSIKTLFINTAFIFAMQTVSAGDIAAGAELAKPCAACHGADGNSINPAWPKIAGQHTNYLSKQLHDFKDQKRNNVQMAPMVANLSDQDIEDLSAYFNSKKLKKGTANPDLIEAGEKLYRAGNIESGVAACMACHSPNGSGNSGAGYPMLSGQHADYTATQLRAYRSGERENDANGIMRSVAKYLSDEEIEAVSAYIQGLR